MWRHSIECLPVSLTSARALSAPLCLPPAAPAGLQRQVCASRCDSHRPHRAANFRRAAARRACVRSHAVPKGRRSKPFRQFAYLQRMKLSDYCIGQRTSHRQFSIFVYNFSTAHRWKPCEPGIRTPYRAFSSAAVQPSFRRVEIVQFHLSAENWALHDL